MNPKLQSALEAGIKQAGEKRIALHQLAQKWIEDTLYAKITECVAQELPLFTLYEVPDDLTIDALFVAINQTEGLKAVVERKDSSTTDKVLVITWNIG